MKTRIVKLVSLITLVSISYVPLTQGVFLDVEKLTGNTFAASSLNIVLTKINGSPTGTPVFSVTDLKPGDSESKSVRVSTIGALTPQYIPSITTSGDMALCTALELKATKDAVLVFDGSLSSFAALSSIMSGSSDDWEFTVSLSDTDSALENLTCGFTIAFNAWQQGLPYLNGFHDTELFGNSITSGEWSVAAGSIVINEIMWMGSSSSSDDEWIELRNMTNQEIEIGKWVIDNAKSAGNDYMIPANKTIPANGFFLITNFPKNSAQSSLNVSPDVHGAGLSFANTGNGNLVLRDANGNAIDEALDPWPKGENGSPEKRSMERNDTPGSGTDDANWHTCVSATCNDTIFWDSEADNYGTPGAANHSENDPTAVQKFTQQSLLMVVTDGDDNSSDKTTDDTVDPTPTPTPTFTPTPTPNPTPTATPTSTAEISPTPIPEVPVDDEENEGGEGESNENDEETKSTDDVVQEGVTLPKEEEQADGNIEAQE